MRLKLPIREQITPKGDGNSSFFVTVSIFATFIREQITPKGDGNRLGFFLNSTNLKLENR